MYWKSPLGKYMLQCANAGLAWMSFAFNGTFSFNIVQWDPQHIVAINAKGTTHKQYHSMDTHPSQAPGQCWPHFLCYGWLHVSCVLLGENFYTQYTSFLTLWYIFRLEDPQMIFLFLECRRTCWHPMCQSLSVSLATAAAARWSAQHAIRNGCKIRHRENGLTSAHFKASYL